MSSIRVGIGFSTEKNAQRAAEEAFLQAKTTLGLSHINLAIVFSSTDLAYTSLLQEISLLAEGAAIIGCSSAGIISSQGISRYGVAILLLGFPDGVFVNTGYVKDISKKDMLEAGTQLAEKLLYGFAGVRRDLSIIFSDGIMKDGSQLIHGLQQRLGLSFPLIGASASDDLQFLKTYLYYNQNAWSDSACGLLLGGKINFGIGIRHGWQPLGKMRTITRSQGNTVFEIDGQIATHLYKEYFGFTLSQLRKELKRISVLYPIGLLLPGEKEYLLRNILAVKDDGSIVFQGDVPEGSCMRLMIGTRDSCIEAARQALRDAQSRMLGHPIDFLLVFDSVSRYILLGKDAPRELLALQEEAGQTPIIGFYTYGEQAPLTFINYRGKSYFHNQSICVIAIGG